MKIKVIKINQSYNYIYHGPGFINQYSDSPFYDSLNNKYENQKGVESITLFITTNSYKNFI